MACQNSLEHFWQPCFRISKPVPEVEQARLFTAQPDQFFPKKVYLSNLCLNLINRQYGFPVNIAFNLVVNLIPYLVM